jgi:hypothetical protein
LLRVPILPPPPRATSVGRLVKKLMTAFFLGLLGLGMFGGLGYYAFTLADDLLGDRKVFANGVVAEEADVEGTAKASRLIFHEYKLKLHYTDRNGVVHDEKQEFSTMFGEVDDKSPVEVHYDPAHANRAACSWSVDVSVSRGLWALTSAAIAVLGAFVVWAGARSMRDSVFEREVARDGSEVPVRLEEKSHDQYGNVTFEMTAEIAPGRVHTERVVLNKKSPWRLEGDKALGLYSAQRGRVFLVESDGQPVVLSDAELAEARARAEDPAL